MIRSPKGHDRGFLWFRMSRFGLCGFGFFSGFGVWAKCLGAEVLSLGPFGESDWRLGKGPSKPLNPNPT